MVVAKPHRPKPGNRQDCERLLANLRAEVPAKYRGHVERMAAGSLRAAVNLHCLQCVGYVRSEIAACTSARCPIWPLRPYQRATGTHQEQEAE